MRTVLEVKYVYKKFGDKEVLKGVTFELRNGKVIGLVGEKGSGKTTLFRLIAGLISPDEGGVFIKKNKVSAENHEPLDDFGCLLDEVNLYPSKTGYEHIIWMCTLCNRPIDNYVNDLIQKLKLQDIINNKVKTYSPEMKQRLGILMAFVNKPSLVILDEPTKGLNQEQRTEIRNFLVDMSHQNDITLLVSGENQSEMEQFCDQILFLQDGEIKL